MNTHKCGGWGVFGGVPGQKAGDGLNRRGAETAKEAQSLGAGAVNWALGEGSWKNAFDLHEMGGKLVI